MGWGSIWDGAVDIASGGLDVVQGGTDFVIDALGASRHAFSGDFGAAADTLVASIQDDIVGQSMMGVFGPDGIGGTLIGGLPEDVRAPSRSILTPILESWDWVMEEMVDNPLGTLSTVLYAQTSDGGHSIFDANTWKRAWEINQTRSFGQAAAAGIYGIDPFDEEQFAEIREKPIFNLLSGTFDFMQEFLDPVDIVAGGAYGAVTGSIAYANRAGDLSRVSRAGGFLPGHTRWVPRRTIILPYGPKPATGTARGNALANAAQVQFGKFQRSAVYTDLNRAANAVQGAGDAADAQRLLALQGVMGSQTRKLPDGALPALARARTTAARDRTWRAMSGDMTVFPEVQQVAREAAEWLNNESNVALMDSWEEARRALDADAAKEGVEGAKRLSPEDARRHQATVDALTPEMVKINELRDSVDWRTLYNLDQEILAAQSAGTVYRGGIASEDPNYQLTIWDHPGNEDLAGMAMDDVIAEGEGWGRFGDDMQRVADDPGALDPTKVGIFRASDRGPSSRRPIRRLLERENDQLRRTGQEVSVNTYVNPSVGTGNRFARFLVAPNPQTVLNVQDPFAIENFRRMVTQASEVTMRDRTGNLVRLLDEVEAATIQTQFENLLTAGDPSVWSSEAMTFFNVTVENLNTRLDDLLVENVGGDFAKLQDQYKMAQDEFSTQVRKASADRPTARSVLPDVNDKPANSILIRTKEGDTDTWLDFAMTPSQAQQSAVVPRYDLVNNEIRRFQRLEAGGTGARVQKTKDVVSRSTSPVRDAAGVIMSDVWKPAVLLTPKWPMRVGIDEQLRMMSNLGVLETLSNLAPGMQRLRQVYGAKMASSELGKVQDMFLSRFDELVIEAGGDDTLTLAQKVDLIGGRKGVDDLTKTLVNEQLGRAGSKRMRFSAAGRGAVAGFLMGGPAGGALFGTAYAGLSFGSRRKRIIQAAQRQTALRFGDALLTEGRRTLFDAIDPAEIQAAERLIRRGESIEAMVTADNLAAEVPEALRSQLDLADEFLQEAGMGSLHVGGERIRGWAGDSVAQAEQLNTQLSASRSMNRVLRGADADMHRSLQGYNSKQGWQRYDNLDPDVSAEVRNTRFNRTINQLTPRGPDFRHNFYEVIWGEGSPERRIEELAANLDTDAGLRNQLGIPSKLVGTEQMTEIAEEIVRNADNVLPLRGEFAELRASVAAGGEVSWQQVEEVLMGMADDLGEGVMWQDVARTIREGSNDIPAHPGFGKSISPEEGLNPGRSKLFPRLNEIFDSVFENYGTLPTDELARQPFFRSKYEKDVTRRVELFADPDGNVNLTQTQLNQIEKSSRDYALAETRNLLYDLAEETRVGEVTTNIMPFYNAWYEVLSRWAGLTIDNPYFTGKMIRLYTAEWDAPALGIAEAFIPDDPDDPDGPGSTYLTFRLSSPAWDEDGEQLDSVWDMMPDSVRNLLTPKALRGADQTIRFSKDALNTMLQSTTPGFGPLVTVPVSEAVLREPQLEEAFGFMFPFGHPEGGFLDRLVAQLPVWQQSVKGVIAGGPSTDRVVQRLFVDLVTQYAEAGDPINFSDPVEVNALIAEANSRAQDFNMFRAFTGFVSPASTTLMSPYEPMIQEMRELRRQYSGDERQAQAVFLARYGEDFFALASRMTRLNDGVAASLESEELYMDHQELISAYPEIGGWLSNSIGSTDEQFKFSQAAYRRQQNMQISETDTRLRRERKSPVETVTDVQSDMGWREWAEISDQVRTMQAERAAVGLSSSLNSKDMEPVRLWKKANRDALAAKYPAWWEEYNDFGASAARQEQTVQGFMAALNDESVLARPSTDNVIKYMQGRMAVQGVLQARSQNGGSDNLEARSNDDLMTWWEIHKQEMSDRPDFSAIFDRYFERDIVAPATFYKGPIPKVLING